MSQYYVEFPVRCMTCNLPLAHLQESYETLLRGDIERRKEALDVLGLVQTCCRTNMMDPHLVFFDNENKQLIRGQVRPETSGFGGPRGRPEATVARRAIPVKASVAGLSVRTKIPVPGTVPENTIATPAQPSLLSLVDEEAPIVNYNLAASEDISGVNTEALLNLELPEVVDKSAFPTMIGIPVILPSTAPNEQIVNVGVGQTTVICSNRRYLCR